MKTVDIDKRVKWTNQRTWLIAAGIVTAGALALDLLRRALWANAAAQAFSWGLWVGAGILDYGIWLAYFAIQLQLSVRFSRGSTTRMLLINTLGFVVLTTVHTTALALFYQSVGVPGADDAGAWILIHDVWLHIVNKDLLVAVLTLVMLGVRERLVAVSGPGPSSRLSIDTGDRLVSLEANDILLVRSDLNYLEIETRERNHRVRGNLTRFINRLPRDQFIQTHRSVVVNLDRVQSLLRGPGGWRLTLEGDHAAPVSRRRLASVREALLRAQSPSIPENGPLIP